MITQNIKSVVKIQIKYVATLNRCIF